MDKQKVTDQLDLLPEHLQQEVVDFIEFLTMKYLEDEIEADFDLSRLSSRVTRGGQSRIENEELFDELKAFLDERIAFYRANPESAGK